MCRRGGRHTLQEASDEAVRSRWDWLSRRCRDSSRRRRPRVPMTTAPEIPFESVPDFLKLPDGHHSERSPASRSTRRGTIFVSTRSSSASGPAFGPVAAQLLEFGPSGEFVREIGKNLYGSAFAHSGARRQGRHIWAVDKGSNILHQLQPEPAAPTGSSTAARRRPTAPKPWEQVEAAGLPRRPVPPADRRRLGFAGQHLHRRRLRQLARREVRQERQRGQLVRRPGKGPGVRTPHAIAIDKNDNV